jgi:nucleoporin NDC1
VENIYTPTPSKLISKAKDLAKGRSTDYANPPMLIAEKGLQTLLSDEARAKVNPGAIVEGAGGLFSQILRTPLGYPFRQTFDRHITGIVCGTPYSQTSILVDAIDALTKLAVHSISEDQPGQVQKDIESICRTFAAAIVQVQDFVATTPPHWTDMEFTERKRRPSPEIEALLEALRWGLEEIMRAFGEYFDALNISRSQQKQWTQLLAAPKPAPPVRQIVAEKRAFARPRTPPMQQASR